MSLATLGAMLNALGRTVRLFDLSVTAFTPADLARTELALIAVPLFDALPSAVALAAFLRRAYPKLTLAFYGAHAQLNQAALRERFDALVLDDLSVELPALLDTLAIGPDRPASGDGQLPDRRSLPGLSAYTYPGGLLTGRIVGNLEATGGCRYMCSHCTVFTLARGKVAYHALDRIMADIRQLVELGAEHITFMDAEFMNNGDHGPAVIEAMHREFPLLTFDLISRVDRILKFPDAFERFFECGCTFVTTALEFPNNEVLRLLRKGYRVKDLATLSERVHTTSLRINPTLIMFNPWVDVDDIEWGERFLSDTGLSEIIDPIQYETRLMITKRSPLLETDALRDIELIEREFHYDWTHPDPAVDALYAERTMRYHADSEFKRCCIRC